MFDWFRKAYAAIKSKTVAAYTGAMGYKMLPMSVDRMLAAADQNVWFAGVVHKVGDIGASIPWILYEYREKGFKLKVPREIMTRSTQTKKITEGLLESKNLVRVNDHPFLDLMDRPNPVMDKWEFLYTLIGYMLTVGEVFVHKVRNQNGEIIEIYPLCPTWIQKTPSRDYPYYLVVRNGVADKIPEADIMHKRRPKLIDPYGRGVGIGAALGDEISIDQQASQTQYAYFANGARPSILIGVEGASEDDIIAAKAKWLQENQGPSRAGSTHFYSGKINAQSFGESLADMQMSQLRKEQRNTVIQGTGTPPEIMGILENSNRSTIDAADMFFRIFVLSPILDRLWYGFQYDILPETRGPKNLLVDYINQIPEDMETKIALLKIAPTIATVNEWRNLCGLPDVDWGKDRLEQSAPQPTERTDQQKKEDAASKKHVL